MFNNYFLKFVHLALSPQCLRRLSWAESNLIDNADNNLYEAYFCSFSQQVRLSKDVLC